MGFQNAYQSSQTIEDAIRCCKILLVTSKSSCSTSPGTNESSAWTRITRRKLMGTEEVETGVKCGTPLADGPSVGRSPVGINDELDPPSTTSRAVQWILLFHLSVSPASYKSDPPGTCIDQIASTQNMARSSESASQHIRFT